MPTGFLLTLNNGGHLISDNSLSPHVSELTYQQRFLVANFSEMFIKKNATSIRKYPYGNPVCENFGYFVHPG